MRNIAIMGTIASGKTTLSRYLVDMCGFTSLSFANALKDEICESLGITRTELEANKQKYRDILQEVGEGKRKGNPLYWCHTLYVQMPNTNNAPYVIDDCRYVNEAKWLQNKQRNPVDGFGNFIIVKIIVDPLTQYERFVNKYGINAYNRDQFMHISEIENHLIKPDLLINGLWDIHQQAAFILGYCAGNQIGLR